MFSNFINTFNPVLIWMESLPMLSSLAAWSRKVRNNTSISLTLNNKSQ